MNNTFPGLPPSFVDRIFSRFGGEASEFLSAFSTSSPVSVRVNPAKPAFALPPDRVPWSSHGYYLAERPVFTLDPLLHGGAYYVQEASSMFVEQAVRQSVDTTKPLRVLDLCAAPGGKSTLLASLLCPGSLLVANEVIKTRADILAENLTKWGAAQAVVTNNDPSDFGRLEGFFDVLVVDAPCSGEGLFRKTPEAAGEWSLAHAALCSERQRRILMQAWPALRPGGVLIYSTCTFNPAENEENIAWLAAKTELEPIGLETASDWQIREIEVGGLTGYTFLPHRARGEGFFLCALRKTDGMEWNTQRKSRFPLAEAGKREVHEVEKWLNAEHHLVLHHESIIALPHSGWESWAPVLKELRVVQGGVRMAEIKKKNLTPTPALALSTIINRNAFEQLNLTLQEALHYLRKEEWPIETGKDGWQLVSYQNLPLGWLKKIGTRFNNYYPLHWRIRMEIK